MGKSGTKLHPIREQGRFKTFKKALAKRADSSASATNVSRHGDSILRHAKEGLGKLTDNLFYLLDKIPIGIALISQKNLSIIYANSTCLDIFCCDSIDEALALSWDDILSPDSHKLLLKSMMRPLLRPEYFYLEIKRKDGKTRDVKVCLSDMFKDDEECSLLFFEDITEPGVSKRAHQENANNSNLESLLEAFSYRIIEVQEDERRRISYELHDELGQILTAIQLMLSRAKSTSAKHNNPEHNESETLIKDAIERVRNLSLDLNPRMIETQGLIPTLAEYFKRYNLWSKLIVNFKHAGFEEQEIPAVINNTVYRTIQESLTNVARYAGVNSVNVAIQANPSTVRIRVVDKGKGFNPKTIVIGRSGGLSGIYERVLLLKGKLEIDSAPGKGTSLTAEIPLSTNMNGKR
jgi:PAS domain S-box-containing protein